MALFSLNPNDQLQRIKPTQSFNCFFLNHWNRNKQVAEDGGARSMLFCIILMYFIKGPKKITSPAPCFSVSFLCILSRVPKNYIQFEVGHQEIREIIFRVLSSVDKHLLCGTIFWLKSVLRYLKHPHLALWIWIRVESLTWIAPSAASPPCTAFDSMSMSCA